MTMTATVQYDIDINIMRINNTCRKEADVHDRADSGCCKRSTPKRTICASRWDFPAMITYFRYCDMSSYVTSLPANA